MIHPVSLGACPRCGNDLVVPSYVSGRAEPRCVHCAPALPSQLDAARGFVREVHGDSKEVELCLHFGSYTGQYLAALLSGDRSAAKAFLANALAVGEILLAIPGDGA